MLPNHFRSLVLTTLFGFTTPIIVVGGTLASLSILGYVPGFSRLGHLGASQLLEFLAIFGNGCPLQGILTIGLTGGVVGGLFDLFNFYRYQTLRSH
jgi:hypothetical protein